MVTARVDRILYWPTAITIVLFLLFTWSAAFGLDLNYLGTPFIFFYWLVSAGAGVIACIAWACERAWRRFLSTLILPLSVLAAGFDLQGLGRAAELLRVSLAGWK